MSDQSEALRLAEELGAPFQCDFHVVCEEAAAELRRLHEENERLNADIESWRMTLAAATTLGEKVTAENERLRADAERYRWHRAMAKHMGHSPEVMDAVTDEAMKRAAQRQEETK